MPSVDIFPDIHTESDLQMAIFSFPPDEIEKYDRASRELILATLARKAEAVGVRLPDYYISNPQDLDRVDAYQTMIGFVPVSLLGQVNEMWGTDFTSLEQYSVATEALRQSTPRLVVYSQDD